MSRSGLEEIRTISKTNHKNEHFRHCEKLKLVIHIKRQKRTYFFSVAPGARGFWDAAIVVKLRNNDNNSFMKYFKIINKKKHV